MARVGVGLWLLLVSCRGEPLRAADVELLLEPASVDLGQVVLGGAREAVLEARNAGRAPLDLTWELDRAECQLVEGPERLAGGHSRAVRVRCAPAQKGPLRVELRASVGGLVAQTAELRVEGVEPPVCHSTACRGSELDVERGVCVETVRPDGAPCTPSSPCVELGRCQAGACVGSEVSCDDGDACTVDGCDAEQGCVHWAAPPCPGDGKCRQGECNPKVGCELRPAPDGTVCGRSGCTLADVCIDGACVERDPPDGFRCASTSPCQGEGRCVADVCVRPPPTALVPFAEVGAFLPDGGPPEAWSDVLLGPTGRPALASYFLTPVRLGPLSTTPVDLPTSARRCIFWGEELACADYPTTVAAGVSLLSAVSGKTSWTYTQVLRDVPALDGPGRNTFLARLVALSSGRLAALFETRTVVNGADLLCRLFAVVVLDRSGTKVAAWLVDDDLFDRCVHPHSYGVAADRHGQLYLAFTPSIQHNPALPTQGTLVLSYGPLGALRWKRWEPSLPGGELAVAQGALLHQEQATVLHASDGGVAGALPRPFGRGVATHLAVVSGPRLGSGTLEAIDAVTLGPKWSYLAGGGRAFATDELRLASWNEPAGPRQVVLGFLQGVGVSLLAIDAATGVEVFSCPLQLPEPPSAFEVDSDGLWLMSQARPVWGSSPCESCDPRYARTRARFSYFRLVGLGSTHAPWTGTHGGPGHDHREDSFP